MNRRLARYAAAAAFRAGISPNGVTFLSAISSAIGLALVVVVVPSPAVGVAVGLLLALGYVLDSADGQVARLSGKASKAGEWLDHVVDAIRSPAIHLAVVVGLWTDDGVSWPQVVALAYCLVAAGQFMSQILAEQLRKAAGTSTSRGSDRQSFVLLPTDFGILCLSFLLWGWPPAFITAYTVLFIVNTAHAAVSMRRRYRQLVAIDRGSEE